MDDMIPIVDAARALKVLPQTIRNWERVGKVNGVAQDDRGAWLVRRSEVDRILAEREQVATERVARWRPMTDRRQVHGHAHDDGEGQHAEAPDDELDKRVGAVAHVTPGSVTVTGAQVVASVSAVATVAPGTVTVTGSQVTGRVMPEKVSWRRWQAEDPIEPGELITRDDLIQRLTAEGVAVTAADLIYWQRRGVIPYGERQWDGRVAHVYYPAWMVDVVRELRAQQAAGVRLRSLRPHLMAFTRELTSRHRHITMADVGTMTGADAATVQAATVHPLAAEVHGTSAASAELTVAYSPIAFHAMEIARIYQENGAPRIKRAEVRLIDERGNIHSLAVEFTVTVTG